jgi:hypothetical protein
MRTIIYPGVLLLLLGLASCGGAGNHGLDDSLAAAGPAAGPAAGISLPSPGEITRATSANAQQRLRLGAEYLPGLAANAGQLNDIEAAFEPEYNGVDQFSAAWLMYSYFLPDYEEGDRARVYFSDDSPLPAGGDVWLGFADWATDRWRWRAVPTAGASSALVDVASVPVADYVGEDGQLLACLLCLGSDPVVVSGLLIGDELGPIAVPIASPSLLSSDSSTTLDGTHSFSEFSSIDSYEWDVDGDGEFDETTAIVDAVEFEPGLHEVTLRVTDDDGLMAQNTATVMVWDANDPPMGYELENNDDQGGAQQLPSVPFEQFTGNVGTGGGNDGDKQDWFEFDWFYDSSFTAWLQTDGAANAGLQLYDQFGKLVADVDTKEDWEIMTVQLKAGSYFLKIHTMNSAETATDYALTTFSSFPNEAPVAYLTAAPATLVQGQQVDLHANQSYDFDGTIDEYRWDLYGDGSFERSGSESSTTYTVMRVGEFNATVRVVDNNGAWAEYSVPITVSGDQQYDEMENNDTTAGAMDLSWFPESGTSSFVGDVGQGGGFDGDYVDIFSFTVAEAGNVQWILNTLDPEHGDLELQLLFVEGNNSHILAMDDSGNDVLAISEDLTETAGIYYLFVLAQQGSSRYDFSLYFTPDA